MRPLQRAALSAVLLLLVCQGAPCAVRSADDLAVLKERALAISPDGRWLAYGQSLRQGAGATELWVAALTTGEKHKLDEVDPGQLPSQFDTIRPMWSPDGSRLAYFFLHEDGLRLYVWSTVQKKVIHKSSEPNAAEGMSRMWPPQWTADSRHVLFVAADSVAQSAKAAKFGAGWGQLTLQQELHGLIPAENGVTVLKSSGAQAADRAGDLTLARTHIVALDVESGKEQTLASGATFVGVRVATRGRRAIAIAVEPSRSAPYSVYELPLKISGPPAGNKSTAQPPAVDADGRKLRRLAKGFPQFYGLSISLAPSGKYFAYTTSTQDATGDVFVVNLHTGVQRNVTAAVVLPQNPLDRITVTGLRDLGWRGKFGSWTVPPIWSADESALLVPRAVSRQQGPIGIHVDLWRIPRDGRQSSRVPIDPKISITGLAQCGDSGDLCLVGPAKELIVRVRLEKPLPEADQTAIAALDPQTGRVRILRMIGTPGVPSLPYEVEMDVYAHHLVVARNASVAIGFEETQERPAELWGMWLKSPTTAKSLELLNPGPAPPIGKYVRVSWMSEQGERLEGALRLPAGLGKNERPPVIISVYGGKGHSLNGDGEFDGGADPFAALRRKDRFATLAADLQSAQPPGAYCDQAAKNVEAALDAAIATGLIDGTRAGLIGHSFGGYTVNCVVTRSHRLKAGVASAGMSNLTLEAKNFAQGSFTNYLGWQGGPWEQSQVFVNDSPIFHLNRVTTPLLILYGKQSTSDTAHAIQMFNGLSALGKPAELVGYDASDHTAMLTYPDYWSRIIGWFDRWLRAKDASAAHVIDRLALPEKRDSRDARG